MEADFLETFEDCEQETNSKTKTVTEQAEEIHETFAILTTKHNVINPSHWRIEILSN